MQDKNFEYDKQKFNGLSRKERRRIQREAGGFKNKANREFFKGMRVGKKDSNDGDRQ